MNTALAGAGERLFTSPTRENYHAIKIAIVSAETEFKKHRGVWSQIHPVIKAILGILSLIPLGIPALIVSNTYGYHNTFFGKSDDAPTDSFIKLQQFKKNIERFESAIPFEEARTKRLLAN